MFASCCTRARSSSDGGILGPARRSSSRAPSFKLSSDCANLLGVLLCTIVLLFPASWTLLEVVLKRDREYLGLAFK